MLYNSEQTLMMDYEFGFLGTRTKSEELEKRRLRHLMVAIFLKTKLKENP